MTNINTAFEQFQKQYTTLDPDDSDKAKGSRDWLLERVADFNDKKDFISLADQFNMPFGSFARKTKIPALDDIDLLVGLNGHGCTYDGLAKWDNIPITVGTPLLDMSELCFEDSQILNSRKVINRFVSKLKDVPHYSQAEIKRNGQACTLKLSSYSWNFDIVPAFFTETDNFGRAYYLIPNGSGNWMKTDPRIDKDRMTKINQQNSGRALPMIRLIKYWQRRATMPTMSSYLLETICLDYLARSIFAISQFPDITLPSLFQHIALAIQGPVPDPKGIVFDINNTAAEDRQAIANRALQDYQLAIDARQKEKAGDIRGCFEAWGKIFGPSFPTYSE